MPPVYGRNAEAVRKGGGGCPRGSIKFFAFMAISGGQGKSVPFPEPNSPDEREGNLSGFLKQALSPAVKP